MSRIKSLGVWLLGFGALLFSLSLTVNAGEALPPFTAVFSVHRNIIPLGELALSFNLDETGEYIYRAHTRPGMLAGLFNRNEVVEESRGHLKLGMVTPRRYTYRDEDEATENSDILFDWASLSVDTSSGGITWSQAIPVGAQDKLSQQLQVRLHLAQGRKEISYQVADGGKLKTYQFQVDGEETLETPYGPLDCLRVKRRKESRPPDYTIWFAPKLDYLPIKIERTQGERVYRMVLDELGPVNTN